MEILIARSLGMTVGLDEARLIAFGQRDAGGAVGLVADHQVELRESVLLCPRDDVD